MNIEKGQYVTNARTMMPSEKAILQLARYFRRDVEFINSAENVKAWLGTSEFFLINATDFADFIA